MLKELTKVANTLDSRGHLKLADRLDAVILKLAEEMGDSTFEQAGDMTIVNRTDGKVVLVGKEVIEHIGTHQKLGIGSIFSGKISEAQILDFVASAPLQSGGKPFYDASFPGGGYELVKPYDYAMELPDAKRQDGPPHKSEFSQEAGSMVDVPVAKVATSAGIEEFSTDATTVIIPNYDPKFADEETKSLVEERFSEVRDAGDLFALATAFPGGMTIEGQSVPRSSEWGGTESPAWAVILPNQNAVDSDENLEEQPEEDTTNF